MLGLDKQTGRALSGWEHVIQSLEIIFSTRFHERVMLRYFGSLIPHMLGENMVERTMLKFFYSVAVAIELWEPRFRLVHIEINEMNRQGFMSFRLDGIYYPNALSGDFATETRRALFILARQTGLVVLPNSEVAA